MWSKPPPLRQLHALGWVMVDRLAALSALTHSYPDGVVLRLPRRRLVVLSAPEDVKHVLVDNARGYGKGLGQAESSTWLGHGVLTAEGVTWQEQREAVTQRLAGRRVRALGPEICAMAEASVSALVPREWVRLDPRDHLAQYTTDVLARVFDLAAPNVTEFSADFEALQRRVMVDTTTQQLVPRWARPVSAIRNARRRSRLHRLAAIALGAGTPEAWARPDRMLTLWLAGYETTAATLSWALWFLSARPDLQEQIAAEARTELAREWGEHGPDLPTARAVFRETLRLRPPVWLISRRALEDDRVGDNEVRRDDDLAICVHALQQADGDTQFHPGNERTGRSYAFGQGPRACPGAGLADLEATLWLGFACRDLQLRRRPGKTGAPKPVARMSLTPSGFDIDVRARVARPFVNIEKELSR